MLEKAKQLYKLQKEATRIKKQLKKTHIESEFEGVTVVITGEQEVIKVQMNAEAKESKKMEENLVKALNKALKKSQEVAAAMMKEVMGDLQLPGM